MQPSHFAIRIDGARATIDELLPNWDRHDRLGVVVDEPLGPVGASLLLQIFVTTFYESDPQRRGRVYPEVYLFHVGENQRGHGWYDVFPPRKEIVVPDDPAIILEAINDRAITRLAVVDGPVEAARHHHLEPATALDRIASAFAYSAHGRAADADVEIAALDGRAVENTDIVLHPELTQELQDRWLAAIAGVAENEDAVYPDSNEVSLEVRDDLSRRRVGISRDGLPVETYRRLSVADALGMLHARTVVAAAQA